MAVLFPGLFFPWERKPGLAAFTQHQIQAWSRVPESTRAQFLPEHLTFNVSNFAVSSVAGDNISSLSQN